MYRHRHVFNSFSSAFFQFYCNPHSNQVWNATTVRFAKDFVLYISFQLPFAFAAFFFTVYPPYQIRIFPVNSLLISTRNERRFSILVETVAISPAIINLSTRAPISFHFQNKTSNFEDKTAGNAVLFMGGVLQSSNDSGLLCAFCALQVYRPAGIYCILSYSLPFQIMCPLQPPCGRLILYPRRPRPQHPLHHC